MTTETETRLKMKRIQAIAKRREEATPGPHTGYATGAFCYSVLGPPEKRLLGGEPELANSVARPEEIFNTDDALLQTAGPRAERNARFFAYAWKDVGELLAAYVALGSLVGPGGPMHYTCMCDGAGNCLLCKVREVYNRLQQPEPELPPAEGRFRPL